MAKYPDLLVWKWPFENPERWNVYLSLDSGATYQFFDWQAGYQRQHAPDGGSEMMYIVGVDAFGREITHRSNVVRPDDAPVLCFLDGLEAYFGLDEHSGNWLDIIGGQELVVVGDGSPDRVDGKHGNAIQLNGDGASLLSTQDTTLFSPTADGFSVSFWIDFSNLNDPNQETYLLSVWQDQGWPDGSSWHICSYCPADGALAVEILNGSFASLPVPVDFNQGWVHLCLVYDGFQGVWTFYVNGTVAFSFSHGFRFVAGRLGIGADTFPITPPAQGIYDELAFWSRDLSADEVAQLYNNGVGLFFSSF